MEHELYFALPIFHPGINITVRDGEKWMKVNTGDTLLIKEIGFDVASFEDTVVGKAYIPFTMIPDAWLAHEHDPLCKTLTGLLENGMKPVYPDFSAENHVTVIMFTLSA